MVDLGGFNGISCGLDRFAAIQWGFFWDSMDFGENFIMRFHGVCPAESCVNSGKKLSTCHHAKLSPFHHDHGFMAGEKQPNRHGKFMARLATCHGIVPWDDIP